MENQDIFNYLKESGCCKICCLRYIKNKGIEYDNAAGSMKKLGIIDSDNLYEKEEHINKKLKLNSCPACLGLFSTNFIENIIENIAARPELRIYDIDQIVVAISLPMLFHIRQLSFWLVLLDKFNGAFTKDKAPDLPIKEVIKLILNPKLCEKLNKTYDTNGLMINIIFNHDEEQNTLNKICKIEESLSYAEKKNHKKIVITRGLLEKKFIPTRVTLKDLKIEFSVPPSIPTTNVVIENITFKGPTVFVAGRYMKLSRNLSHSPWIIQGKRMMEDSIQEIIVRNAAPHFGVSNENVIFSSSGREDVDVRCLGNGRPFVIEIPNSKCACLSLEHAALIEFEINKSNKIAVKNLQLVEREELFNIKTGEEKKKKTYRALCILKNPATVELMEKLNIKDPFDIEQLTPIRVLHRRPLHNRTRTIHSVKGRVDPNNAKVIVLDIVTQAGTYVKELIHGELGRTSPNISSIIGEWIDIIALDVTKIDLDWPKNIERAK